MLRDGDVRAMETWVLSAQAWSEASQAMVATAAALALTSRTLGDRLTAGNGRVADQASGDRATLAAELSLLAESVEEETRTRRDAFLQTAARIGAYEELLD